jgi:7,8-dihydropterin-6-yl-methyl-4-(beta-D-ribofuranosyl)aminobenzene 5'-phosphate synthase
MVVITDRYAARAVEVTVLADNRADAPCVNERGFSALVRFRYDVTGDEDQEEAREQLESRAGSNVREHHILFDVGRGSLFQNAPLLGVDLSSVDSVVLSHGHYDHTDALADVRARYPGRNYYASRLVFQDHYSLRTGECRRIGLSDEPRAALNDLRCSSLTLVGERSLLANAPAHLVGAIPRVHALETESPLLFLDSTCTVPDPVSDELFLVIDLPEGLCILTGCCHAGIINTCERALSLFPARPLLAVMGGFHLAGCGESRLEATRDYLSAKGVSRLIPCHCTGEEETEWLARELPGRVLRGSVGTVVRFGQ